MPELDGALLMYIIQSIIDIDGNIRALGSGDRLLRAGVGPGAQAQTHQSNALRAPQLLLWLTPGMWDSIWSY